MKALKPKISIVIIFDQFRKDKLWRLLESLKGQVLPHDAEVIFLHESDIVLPKPELPLEARYINIPAKKGIPFNRNKGIEFARGEIVVFIDDDCWVQEGWLSSLLKPLEDKNVLAATSGTKVPPSNLLGDCVAAMGFPGGGSLGFEKVWKVSPSGFTNHLAVGNCALRKSVFKKVGYFDESLKSGAEDAEFSFRLEKSGIPIRYVPEAYAYHEARTTWSSFVRWQLRRGKANFHFRQKVGPVGSFIKLRVWSAKNVLMENKFNLRLPLILFLLLCSLVLQQVGYLKEKLKSRLN